MSLPSIHSHPDDLADRVLLVEAAVDVLGLEVAQRLAHDRHVSDAGAEDLAGKIERKAKKPVNICCRVISQIK